jgi:Tol biopolymer transport system component
MTDSIDRELVGWLSEGPDRGRVEVLDEALARVRRSRQRPGWLAAVTMVRPVDRPVAWVSPAVGRAILVAGLAVALAAALALVAGTPPPESHRLAFTRSGQLWMANADGSSATRVDVATPLPGEVVDVRWSPQRRYLAALVHAIGTENAGWLVILAADGRVIGAHAGDGGMPFSWSPDGSRIAVRDSNGLDVVQILDTHANVTGTVTSPSWVALGYNGWTGSLSWSPDGRWIAVPGCLQPCNPKADADVYLLDPTGGAARRLTSTAAGDGWLAWSSDGRLAVSRTCAAGLPACPRGAVIVTVDSHEQPIADLANRGIGWLSWSPRSGRLAAAVTVTGLTEGLATRLEVVEPNGSARTVIGDGFDRIDLVEWSADGTDLLFLGATTGPSSSGIWSVPANGGRPTLLVNDVESFDGDARP